MNVIFLMIPIALLLSFGFVAAFVWASRNGQWDDLDLAPRKQLLEPNHSGETNDKQP